MRRLLFVGFVICVIAGTSKAQAQAMYSSYDGGNRYDFNIYVRGLKQDSDLVNRSGQSTAGYTICFEDGLAIHSEAPGKW